MNNQSKQFYNWLDPLRFLAAILVLICHARCVVFGYYPELEPSSKGLLAQIFFFICEQGITAVGIFFILSGFLVGGKTLYRIKNNKIQPQQFFYDRLFRISVPLSGSILLIIFINIICGIKNNPLELLGQFMGFQGIFVKDVGGVFWTLAYEIWFYVLLFGIIVYFRKHHFTGSIVMITSLALVGVIHAEWFFVLLLGMTAFFLKAFKLSRMKRLSFLICSFIFISCWFISRTVIGETIFLLNEKFSPLYLILGFGLLAIYISQIVFLPPPPLE